MYIPGKEIFLVGMIFRPPNSENSDAENFLSVFDTLVTTALSQKKPVFIMGDLNINISNHNDNISQNLVNLFHSYGFFPPINKPTRVTGHSAALIDHIWTINFDNC